MSLQFPMSSNSYMPQHIVAFGMPTINSIMAGQSCVQTYTATPMGGYGSGYGGGYGNYQQPSPQGTIQQAVGLLQTVMGLLGQLAGSLGFGGGCMTYPQQTSYPPMGYPQMGGGMPYPQSGWSSNGGASWQQGGCMPPVQFQYDTGGCGCHPGTYYPQPYPAPRPGQVYPPPYPPPVDNNDGFDDIDDPFGDDPFNDDDAIDNNDDPFDDDGAIDNDDDDDDVVNDSDLITITDTATKNSYSFSGSQKNYEIVGNVGDNKFDVRNLDNSDLKINDFNDGDTIRLDVDTLDDLVFETIYDDPSKNVVAIEDLNGNRILVTIPDDKDEEWLKERLLGADGQNLATGTGGATDNLKVVQDTATKNLYNYSGDEKNYRIEGNEGANTFDMRNLTNSNFEIKTFDDDDTIRVNTNDIDDLEIVHNSGQTYTITDPDGNAIKITIPAGEDEEWLQQHLVGDNGQPLVTGGATAKPDWVPQDYTGAYFDTSLTRTDTTWADGGSNINTTQAFDETRINYTIEDKDNSAWASDDENETFQFRGNQSSYLFKGDLRKNNFEIGGTANKIVIEEFGDDETVTGLNKANLVLLNDTTSTPAGQPNGQGGWTLEFFDKATGNHITINTKNSAHNWAWFINNCLK